MMPFADDRQTWNKHSQRSHDSIQEASNGSMGYLCAEEATAGLKQSD